MRKSFKKMASFRRPEDPSRSKTVPSEPLCIPEKKRARDSYSEMEAETETDRRRPHREMKERDREWGGEWRGGGGGGEGERGGEGRREKRNKVKGRKMKSRYRVSTRETGRDGWRVKNSGKDGAPIAAQQDPN